MSTWTNADGLKVTFGPKETVKNLFGVHNHIGEGEVMRADAVAAEMTTTVHEQFESGAFIPAGALIESATIVVTEAFDSAGDTATLSISSYGEDGLVATAGGIDATIAQTAIDAEGDVVECDGSLIGTVATENLYLALVYGTEPFTAGKARVSVKYSV